MKIKIVVLLLFAISVYAGGKTKSKLPVDYVNPFICTQGDHGQWLPSANVPFGLIGLSPDTYPGSLTANGNFAHGGYDYSDSQLRGFSQFHKGSSGGTRKVNRAGLLSIIPFAAVPNDTFYNNPILDFDKKSETAKAGYYSVRLIKDNILTELTASSHVGYHKYTFQKENEAKIFLYEGNRDRSKNISCKLIDEFTVEGKQAVYNGIHFVIKFNSPVKSTKIWNGKNSAEGNELNNCEDGGLILNFGNLESDALEVKVGVSLTSINAARKNLQSEIPSFNFAVVKKNAFEAWNKILSKITIEGNEEYKTIFYTALYHTCFLPVTTTDVEGIYPGLDEKIHYAEGYIHYDTYAFWDSFRTKYPLYSLFLPSVYRDIVKSLRDIYEQGDWDKPDGNHLPHGPGSGLNITGKNGFLAYDNTRNEHMLMVVTDAYFKGISGLDANTIYPFIKREALIQMGTKYDEIGYIPARPDETGEYSWDSWCVAQVAKVIGNSDDYEYFMNRSNYWRNTWDASIKYFRARSEDGSWLDFPEDPTINREKYTYEGSKWQLRWNVVHDLPSLIENFGGNEKFVKELSYFFDNDLYTAGNQIDLHAPFLFNYANASWLTQKWSHKILTEPIMQLYKTHGFFDKPIFGRIFKTTPDGFLEEMDDDYGCMSAWYAISSMGLYQVCPGDPVYQLTSPIFDKVTIKLDSTLYSGNEFVIESKNLNKDNYYIQSAVLNGKALNRSWISHEEIVKGGKLSFVMGKEPNKEWGNK
ncbi:MAG: GH92 family glycosyl hydrolase [Melioribacteraceae bacterium]